MVTEVGLRVSGATEIATPSTGAFLSSSSVATSPVTANNGAAASTNAQAYDARFAHAVVCLCAKQPAVHAAVEHLVSAVRDAAAVVSQLHSEELVDQQCTLLSRMFEFDGFLW